MAAALPQLVPIPPVRHISAAVLAVLGQNPGKFTLQGTNTYIVGKGASRILVDAGQGVDAYEQLLLSSLRDAGVCAISHILITHRHHDHVGGIQQVLRVASALGQDPATVKIHKWIDASSGSSTKSEPIPHSFLPIADQQIFQTDGATLTALHTPGHTSDHVSFFFAEESAIFTGDCILGQGSAVFERLGQLLASLSRLLDLKPMRLYPGHGPVVEPAEPKIQEYINHRLDRERQIISIMRRSDNPNGWTPLDLTREIYVGYPTELLPAAQNSVVQHLEKLEEEKIAERIRFQDANQQESVEIWRLC